MQFISLEWTRAQAVAAMVAAGIALVPASLARVVGNTTAVIPLKKLPASPTSSPAPPPSLLWR